MADQKLSQLTNITSLSDTDELYVNDGGTSKAVEFSALRDRIREDEGSGGELGFNQGRLNAFSVRLLNDSGTLKHSAQSVYVGNYANLGPAVNGLSGTLVATPTGPDATTAFVNGVKISSARPYAIYLDTADLASLASSVMINVGMFYNTTGSGIYIAPTTEAININGVTINRLRFDCRDATTNATFDLNTTNITAGKEFYLNVFGFLPDYS